LYDSSFTISRPADKAGKELPVTTLCLTPGVFSVFAVFDGKKEVQGEHGGRSKTDRKIHSVVPGDKADVPLNPGGQQKIVYYRETADTDRYRHENKTVKNEVPLRICREAEHPGWPRQRFPEKIGIDEIIE
jgi:hypothetical protein